VLSPTAPSFGGRGRAHETAAHHLCANGTLPDERGDVEGDAGATHLVEILGNIDAREAAVARDDRRHAHPNVVLRDRQILQFLRVGVDVDKPGCDDLARGVDLAACRADHCTDGDDPSVTNRDVAGPRRGARAVDDPAVADDEVVVGGVSGPGGDGCCGRPDEGEKRKADHVESGRAAAAFEI
jgi:hypothetical protein